MQFFGATEINPSPPAVTASGNNAHMIYIFNRNGVCLLYREWNRQLHTLDPQQDHKLMFGLLFSLKSLTAKMDPTCAEKVNLGVPQLPGQGCSFHSFRTNTYKLSFMETPSGIKLILVTHPRTGDLRESLKYIYNMYVEYVVKNPLYSPGTPIRLGMTFDGVPCGGSKDGGTGGGAAGDDGGVDQHMGRIAEVGLVREGFWVVVSRTELFNTTLDQYVRGLG
ncbi:hypothetical protein KSS87_019232 [Heliosperma pusillum]|nr:hypothetical protein KSS87_019232 [Heliosperma pusillum]